MALTETRPETTMGPDGEETSPATLDGFIGSSDHKTIGRAWIALGLIMLVGAAVITAVAGFEATSLSGYDIVEDGEEFTQVWSLGRELLLLGGIVPILIGLATYLVPLQIGAPAIAFPRGAAGAMWTWLLGVALLIGSYLLNGGPGGGQTDFVVLWAVSLGMMLAALTWAMVVIATTILGARTQGMVLERVPHTTWSFLVFSLIGLLALPIMMAELVLIYVQVRHGFLPLGARDGLTGVLSGLSLAPGVYWVGIPLLGMAVDMIGVHTEAPVRAHRPIMMAVGLFGILAYGMDYFAMGSGRALDFNNELLALTLALGVLPVLAVLGLAGSSLRGGKLNITPPLVGSLVAGLLLLLATIVSLLGLAEPVALFLAEDLDANVDLDRLLVLNGTTFHDGVRGIVMGAAVVIVIAALHHWSTKIWGRRAAQPLGFLAILAAAAGAVLWGAGGVLAGVDDQAAYPVSTLVGGENVETFNVLAWVGMLLVLVGAVVGLGSVAGAIVGSGARRGDAWTGTTLEWLAASPPTTGNFGSPPVVASAFPLEDLAAAGEAETAVDADGASNDAEEA
ncbi:MAG: cbb3-type cytochrome c oxidase subunit I [Actinomycetota bacterium]